MLLQNKVKLRLCRFAISIRAVSPRHNKLLSSSPSSLDIFSTLHPVSATSSLFLTVFITLVSSLLSYALHKGCVEHVFTSSPLHSHVVIGRSHQTSVSAFRACNCRHSLKTTLCRINVPCRQIVTSKLVTESLPSQSQRRGNKEKEGRRNAPKSVAIRLLLAA